MKPRDYCCCAIPVLNTGIYLAIIVQFIVALVAGILALATPPFVGAVTPSFAPWIFAIVCFIGAAIQLLGIIGVKSEKTTLFRRYVIFHGPILVAAFAVAAAWIIISAARHTTAQDNCLNRFFPGETSSSGEGSTLCNIFPWVNVGIMGGLWVVLAIFFVYLWVTLSCYGRDQRADHEKYDQLHSFPVDNSIPIHDPWDSRVSYEDLQNPHARPSNVYGHVRQESGASASDIMNEPYQHPNQHYRY